MSRQSRAAFAQLVVYGELILALLVLTAAGAKLYGSALWAKQTHSHQRLALSYVQSQALGFSGENLLVSTGPEGDMLVLREANGAYETRIYVHDGALRSEFGPVGSPISPENSQTICDLEKLTLVWDSESLLLIDADGMAGTVCSRGGGHSEA